MRRTTVVAALVALVTGLAGAVPAGAVTPTAASQPMTDVIVVLRSQVDPDTIRAGSRRERLAALVRALQARADADQPALLDLLRRRQAEGLVGAITRLWIRNAVAVTAAPSVVAELAARPDVREVDPDRTILAPSAVSATAEITGAPAEPNVEAVGAPALWNLGYTGQGTVVATMDTGVDASHPDLGAAWRGGTNSWFDPNGEHPAVPTDVNGHGTATMGVILGGSAGGSSVGVAPGARWVAVKIFNDRGSATTTGIHRGYQWLLDPDSNPATADAPNVVNNSWTGASGGCNLDFQADLRALRAVAIMPVFSAGNYGSAPGTVLSPANNPEALSVGAIDDAGVIDPSSSRGPSACDNRIAPRLVAPGVGVRTTDLYGGYLDTSGTSIAAPHVTGTLALLLSAYPGLSADRQQAALESTGADLGGAGADNTYGYGRVDALAAYHWLADTADFTLGVTPASAAVPPGGTASFAVAVSGVNGFAADVALTVSGLPATQATATVTPATVPGGTGTAQVAVTTAASLAPGTYPFTVTGTGGGLTRTATAQLTVNPPPDFTLAATPTSAGTVAGNAATFAVTVSGVNGFTGTVTPTVTGLPGSATASFAPATVTGSGTTTLTVTTGVSTPPGQYPLTITGTSGSTTHATGVTLAVTPPPDFTVTATPASISVLRRQTAGYTVSIGGTGGFTGAVTLSVTGTPAATSAGFTTNPVTAPGGSTLRVTTTGQTPRGTFTLRITGTNSAVQHSVNVTLIVR